MAPPALGQHTDTILAEDVRLTTAEIDLLREKKVV
jgi:crotonobetainyl-CoA:carnitine CoA-transferase CaiB-like acyl-CoA transferase